ncbi:MAG: hypothetical protein AB7G93_11225 [Bdellovibrionales bacterium]
MTAVKKRSGILGNDEIGSYWGILQPTTGLRSYKYNLITDERVFYLQIPQRMMNHGFPLQPSMEAYF